MFSNLIRGRRLQKGLKLTDVSRSIQIDPALISKIERGERSATRQQALALVDFYGLRKNSALAAWMSDRIVSEIHKESFSLKALRLAEKVMKERIEEQVKERASIKGDIDALIANADRLKSEWETHKPANKEELHNIYNYFNASNTYESTTISGNTMTFQDTQLIVSKGLTVQGKTMNEHLEISNHFDAIGYVREIAASQKAFTPELLKNIQQIVIGATNRPIAGVYRKGPVKTDKPYFKPPKANQINRLIDGVFDYLERNEDKQHSLIRAAEALLRITNFHPFEDGNGRTARLMMNLVLLRNGFPIATFKSDEEELKKFNEALVQSRSSLDKKPMYRLVIQTVLDSLRNHLEMVDR